MKRFLINKIPDVIVLALALVINFAVAWPFLDLPPASIHSWAQSDRASVARNFSQDSINILYPRVHRTEKGEGITGMEFPFVNWIVGGAYKIFGFHHFLYRGFILFLVCLAFYAFFLILRQETGQSLISFLIILFLFSSPMFLYYSSNFLPDTVSVSFYVIGLYFCYKHIKGISKVGLSIGTTCFILAGLIKISILMAVFPVWAVLFWRVKGSKANLSIYACYFVIQLILIGVWYGWATHLNHKYNARYFMLTGHPINFELMKYVIQVIVKDWLLHYFHWIQIGVLLICVPFVFRYLFESTPFLIYVVTYSVLGFSYFIVMGKQFFHHDYYFIVYYPLIWMIQVGMALKLVQYERKRRSYSLVIAVAFVLCTSGFLLGVYNGYYERYYGKYSSYPIDLYQDLSGGEEYLDKLGINYNDKIMIGPDPTTQLSLYLVNRKGWQFTENISVRDFIQMAEEGPTYIVSISRSFESRPGIKEYLSNKKIGDFRAMSVFKAN